MVYLVRLSPEASDDVERIYWRVVEQAPVHGQEWYNGLISALNSLSSNPERCAFSLDPLLRGLGVRQLLYGKKPHVYRILYRVLEPQEAVEILHVRHGAMQQLE